MKPTAKSAASFLSGASVLTLSAVAVKIIGLFYRIPMLSHLGTEGMGYFNTAYELYALFCVISTAGLPVAMSVLISRMESEGQIGGARRVFGISLALFAGVGLCGTLLLWGLADVFAGLLGSPASAACMRAVSPTVLLICLSSAFRGYFQGKRRMLPTAISQVIEATGKLVLGLTLAAYATKVGKDLPTSAAYAVMGLTLGTLISLGYLWAHKTLADRSEPAGRIPSADTPASRTLLKQLLATAIPITMSAGLISLTKCVDLALIQHRLQAVGYTAAEASSLYGCYSTLAVPVFNILPSLSTSVALSVTPALSAALQKGGEGQEELRRNAASALRVTLLLAIPAALGLAVFSEDILSLLFAGEPHAVAQAAPWLSCLGLSVPAACLVTVTGAMLQAAGRAGYPMISMLLGVGVKIVLSYLLLGAEGWGLAGAPVSSLACDTVIVLVNLCFIARFAPAMLPPPREGFSLVALPTVLSVLSVGMVKLLRHMTGLEGVTSMRTLGTVVSVAALYGAGVLLTLLRKKSLSIKKKEDQHESADPNRA